MLKHNFEGDYGDLHWVRTHTVPTHLSLIDGPLVPHNLISASLVEESFCGGPLGRAVLLGALKVVLSKALEWGSCFYRGPAFGEHGGSLFEIKRYINRYVTMLCKRASLCIGAPLGNMEGIRLPGRFERKLNYI
jgi:hypothetical protein